MKVRTMQEMHEDPARVRVTVDVELSQVGTAAQANRIQVLEGELAASQAQAREWDKDRHTERDRADKAVRRIVNAREALLAESVAQARRMDQSGLGRTMAQAIETALAALDAA